MPAIVPISTLPPAISLTGAELVPVVQSGDTVRTTAQAIADLGGTVRSVVAGDNVTVDASDPANPIVSAQSTTGAILPLVLSVRAFNNGGVINFSAVGCPTPNRVAAGGAETPVAGVGNSTKLATFSRSHLATGAAAFNGVEVYSLTQAMFLRTSASLTSAFTLDTLFGFSALLDTHSCLFGLAALETAIVNATVTPSTQANIAGFGKDPGDTNLQFMHNDASGSASKTDTGVLVSSLVGKLLRLQMSGSAAGITARLTDMETDTIVFELTVTTDMPVVDQTLQIHLLTDNASVGGVVTLDFIGYDATITA